MSYVYAGYCAWFSLSVPLLASSSEFISGNAHVCTHFMDVDCVWGPIYLFYNFCY